MHIMKNSWKAKLYAEGCENFIKGVIQ
jgi:hypothetical protein